MSLFLLPDEASRAWWSSGAEFNPSETHRYTLWRRWGEHQAAVRAGFLFEGTLVAGEVASPAWRTPGGAEPLLCMVMLNPSTADQSKLDPTLRRCRAFARAWGLHGFVIVNLFALRSTQPQRLYDHPDPIGTLNDEAIVRAVDRCQVTLAGWGVHGTHLDRGRQVAELLGDRSVWCLGRNKDGSPKHPLYVPGNTKPVLFSGKHEGATPWKS